MDLVRVLETYCEANNIEFMYGSKSHLNLLESEITGEKVHLLLFPVRRSTETNDYNTAIKANVYKGNFFLVVASNLDQHYFNEKEQPQETSKYTKNIEPLITKWKALENYLLGCVGELEVTQWESIDAIDVLDANKDGLWCTYSIKQDV